MYFKLNSKSKNSFVMNLSIFYGYHTIQNQYIIINLKYSWILGWTQIYILGRSKCRVPEYDFVYNLNNQISFYQNSTQLLGLISKESG